MICVVFVLMFDREVECSVYIVASGAVVVEACVDGMVVVLAFAR